MIRLAARSVNAALAVLLFSAAPAPAEEGTAPAGVEAFASAVREGSLTRLLSVWPRKGSVKLFGKKVDYELAAAKAKFDDGVFELLRWPRDGEKGAAARSVFSTQKQVRLWTFTPEGKAGPACTLRSKKGSPAVLVECVEKP